MKNEKGFILLFVLAFLVVLVLIVAGLTILIGGETLDIGAQNDDKRLLYLADAGVERALREIRDDQSSTTQTGVAYIRGGGVTNSGASNPTNLRYQEDGNAVLDSNGDLIDLKTLDTNYANTRITKVELAVLASRSGGSNPPTLEVSYSTDGISFSAPFILTSTSTPDLDTSLEDHYKDVTSDLTWTWSTILASNFTLRAERTAGNRNVNIDQLYLRVTYEIDTRTEAWFTGSYQSYPLSLGAGTVQSVSITDEQGKVHLGTASQTLLNNLFQELGIASGTAGTLATNIVSYRTSTKNFDSVEELQQVTAMTSVNYNLIKDTVTVYSFINTNAYSNTTSNPRITKVSRAPINVNTASREVLEAVLDDASLTLDAGEAATLATDIINARNTAPFTCFYSRDSAVTTDFYEFMRNETVLSSTERNNVIDNADPSALIPVEGFGGYTANTGTEFCYDSNAFKVESVADVGGRDARVKAILGDQGARTFTTFVGDTTSVGYRKENFE